MLDRAYGMSPLSFLITFLHNLYTRTNLRSLSLWVLNSPCWKWPLCNNLLSTYRSLRTEQNHLPNQLVKCQRFSTFHEQISCLRHKNKANSSHIRLALPLRSPSSSLSIERFLFPLPEHLLTRVIHYPCFALVGAILASSPGMC